MQADGARSLSRWNRNGWKKADGKVVANVDLWKLVAKHMHPQVRVLHVNKGKELPGNTTSERAELRAILKRCSLQYPTRSRGRPECMAVKSQSRPEQGTNVYKNNEPVPTLAKVVRYV